MLRIHASTIRPDTRDLVSNGGGSVQLARYISSESVYYENNGIKPFADTTYPHRIFLSEVVEVTRHSVAWHVARAAFLPDAHVVAVHW